MLTIGIQSKVLDFYFLVLPEVPMEDQGKYNCDLSFMTEKWNL